MICEECRRVVVFEHKDCNGDPRMTCAAWHCGRSIDVWRLMEIYATGDRRSVGYCQYHDPKDDLA